MINAIDPTLPAIDWTHAEGINAKTPGLSKELFAMFMRQLPAEQAAINQAFQEKDWSELEDRLHKFHGACAYCGLPRLKSLMKIFAKALQQQSELDVALLEAFNREVAQVKAQLENRRLV
jgi:two-component system sensor histidine kinase BarA